MSIQFLQLPASSSLAQSPIIFSVKESETGTIASSSFQYVGELYYWTGSDANSGSLPNFTFAKYPNQSLSGIFEMSKILNSLFQESIEAKPSQMYKYKVDFYYQYLDSTQNVTGSHVETGIYNAIDGYSLFGESLVEDISSKTEFWPIMTSGPSVQTVYSGSKGQMGVFAYDSGNNVPTKMVYSGSNGQIAEYPISSSTNTDESIKKFPIGLAETDFPLSASVDWYNVSAYSGSTVLGSNIRFNTECEQKYPNVRIKWKNRFGQYDYFNFNLVSEERFSTDIKTFQRQIGSWGSDTLSYNGYDSQIKNYIADSEQTIFVNTDYVSEDYNDIFKQLLLSEEIYWLYDEGNDLVRPLTIETDDITLKTGVKDKLIQYEFKFRYGQTFKLIL